MADSAGPVFPSLRGKRVLITGASGVLGAHFARLLAAQGVGMLWLAGRQAASLDAAVAACQRANGSVARVEALAFDVADDAAVSAAFAQVADAGGLDLLVNNAGVAHSSAALATAAADFDRVLATNLRGAFLCANAAALLFKGNGGGDIVNVASILGLRVAGGVAAYAASKAGLIQLTKALALEWARHGIRVNALAPGYVETNLNRDFLRSPSGEALRLRVPQRRFLVPEDLDAPFLLLASGASSAMTGAVLVVDGGHATNTL